MPRIIIQAISGRTVEQKRDLVQRVTNAVVEAWGVEPEVVTVRIEEVPPENFARAGQLAVDRAPSPEAE